MNPTQQTETTFSQEERTALYKAIQNRWGQSNTTSA